MESSEIDLSEFEETHDNMEGDDNRNNGTDPGDDNGNNGTDPDDDQTRKAKAEPVSGDAGMSMGPIFVYAFF